MKYYSFGHAIVLIVWVGSLSSTGQPLERSKDEELVINRY